MRIDVNQKGDVVLTDVFNGIIIRTDDGDFGVSQRDDGIEITHKGNLVWHSGPSRAIGEGGPGITKSEQFEQDMMDAGIEFTSYQGRQSYKGPAVRTSWDGPRLQDVIWATSVELQWDNMGLDLVVYPK